MGGEGWRAVSEWIKVEVPHVYGSALMSLRVGGQTVLICRDDALDLLEKMQAKIGEMAMPTDARGVVSITDAGGNRYRPA
jgi:hypothetical protein